MTQDNRRFFILTLGRTGSSLLSSILSDAGADFGGLSHDEWDRTGGAFEHPGLVSVVRNFGQLAEIGDTRPYRLFRRLHWDILMHQAKRGLHIVLSDAQFLKGELEHTVHWAGRLGYVPTVVVSYRRFGPLFESIGHMHPQLPDVHARRYVKALRNGLALAKIFGGCVIDYEEIIDPSEIAWASALSEMSGLSEEKLLAARNDRVDTGAEKQDKGIEPFPECVHAYEELRKFKGVIIDPARATQRAMKV